MKAKASECCEVPRAEGVLGVNIIGGGLGVRSPMYLPGMVGVQGVPPGSLDGSSRGCHGESLGEVPVAPSLIMARRIPPIRYPREGCGGIMME